MSRVCKVSGKRTRVGNSIARRGKAKRLGGVGIKITGVTRRKFKPNLQKRRIWVPELGQHVNVRLCVKALKTIDKKGAYNVLVKAGVIQRKKV